MPHPYERLETLCYFIYPFTIYLFLLFPSAIESEQHDYIGGEISIARAKISNSLKGSILIGGTLLKSLSIVDTEISNSRDFGIKLAPTGIAHVKIDSTNIEQNKEGIVITYMSST